MKYKQKYVAAANGEAIGGSLVPVIPMTIKSEESRQMPDDFRSSNEIINEGGDRRDYEFPFATD